MNQINKMKKLFLYIFLVLIFFNSNNLKANDIGDYEIEGIRVGDSMLSFFSIEKINSGLKDWYPDKTFSYTEFSDSKIKDYDKLGFFFKPGDNGYKIYSISGAKFCDDIQDCFKLQKEMEKNFKVNFKHLKKKTDKIKIPDGGDNGTGSIHYQSFWIFKDGGEVFVEIRDWADDSRFSDNVSFNIDSKEFNVWIRKISN